VPVHEAKPLLLIPSSPLHPPAPEDRLAEGVDPPLEMKKVEYTSKLPESEGKDSLAVSV
jgi:hypothetical protein